MKIHPLNPIFYADSKVLILGSFPSVISREKESYYANPSNRFWPMMEIIFSEKITSNTCFLKEQKIALWDVIYSCDIEGSKDSSITNVVKNDLSCILEKSDIQLIVFNGKTAEKWFNKLMEPCEIERFTCPSTSSANAQKCLSDLVNEYRKIKDYL